MATLPEPPQQTTLRVTVTPLESLAQEIFDLPSNVVAKLPTLTEGWFSGVGEDEEGLGEYVKRSPRRALDAAFVEALENTPGAVVAAEPRDVPPEAVSVEALARELSELPGTVATSFSQVWEELPAALAGLGGLLLPAAAAEEDWPPPFEAPSEGHEDGKTLTASGAACQELTEDHFSYVPRLQARAAEVRLLPGGGLQLPLLAPEAGLGAGELIDDQFASWMQGGPGVVRELPAQSFFIAYDDADTSATSLGKTYGPQRRPGQPYTMRPFLVVFERKESPWVAHDFLANFEVRWWDYEFGYFTHPRTDVGVGLCPRFLGPGARGELRYAMSWMQTLDIEVALPLVGGPLQLVRFAGAALEQPVPVFRLQSGWHSPTSQWYLAPMAPPGFEAPAPARFNVSYVSAMRILAQMLQQ